MLDKLRTSLHRSYASHGKICREKFAAPAKLAE
jgi:hypothetical protein